MKTYLLHTTLLLLFIVPSVMAQREWHDGVVILSTNVKLRGQLCYQPQTDVLLFRQNQKTDAWRVYAPGQIHHFSYIADDRLQNFITYEIALPDGETRTLLFKDLFSGASLTLLELSSPGNQLKAVQKSLPKTHRAGWQTQKPWFVWYNDRLVSLDTFAETELDNLLAQSPKPVQQWATQIPRPTTPGALARWLVQFDVKMAHDQPSPVSSPTVTAWWFLR